MTIIINCIDSNSQNSYQPVVSQNNSIENQPAPVSPQVQQPTRQAPGDGPLGIGDLLQAGTNILGGADKVGGDLIGGALKTGKDLLSGNVIGAVKDIGNGIYNTGKDAVGSVVDGVKSIGKGIGNFFSSIF